MIGPAFAQGRGLRWQLESKSAQSRMREAGPMGNVRFVGLDVHKESIAVAVADGDGSAPQTVTTVANDFALLMKWLRKLERQGPVRCCYEAGPTGFALCRERKGAALAGGTRFSSEGGASQALGRHPRQDARGDRRQGQCRAEALGASRPCPSADAAASRGPHPCEGPVQSGSTQEAQRRDRLHPDVRADAARALHERWDLLHHAAAAPELPDPLVYKPDELTAAWSTKTVVRPLWP